MSEADKTISNANGPEYLIVNLLLLSGGKWQDMCHSN